MGAPPPGQKKGLIDLRNGALLQMAEAATLGLPLEVWKTRMGRFRNEGTLTAFRSVYSHGGGGMRGVKAFWAGFSPKMVESSTKGAVLMVAKEGIKDALAKANVDPLVAAVIAGAGGGVAQTIIMAPMTYLVTAAVTGADKKPVLDVVRQTYSSKGIRGFYPGSTAIAFRQGSNWASRQGLTEVIRINYRSTKYGSKDAKLTPNEEVYCGIVGGAMSCWNHPFEVCRIEAQSRAHAGESNMSMLQIMRSVHGEYGVPGLFKGVVPRLMLGIWQDAIFVFRTAVALPSAGLSSHLPGEQDLHSYKLGDGAGMFSWPGQCDGLTDEMQKPSFPSSGEEELFSARANEVQL